MTPDRLAGINTDVDLTSERVLIVDDDIVWQKFAKLAAIKAGVPADNITIVSSLEEAQTELAQGIYTILLTDNDFYPSPDDRTVTNHLGIRLLEDDKLPKPSICFLITGNGLPEELKTRAAATGAGFLAKPYDVSALRDAIKERVALRDSSICHTEGGKLGMNGRGVHAEVALSS